MHVTGLYQLGNEDIKPDWSGICRGLIVEQHRGTFVTESLFSPPQQDRFDACGQLIWTEGLGNVVVRTELEAFEDFVFFALRSKHEDRDIFRFLILLQRAQDLEPSHQGHHHVQENKIRNDFFRFLKGSIAILDGHDDESAVAQFVFNETTNVLLVFSYKNRVRHLDPCLSVSSVESFGVEGQCIL